MTRAQEFKEVKNIISEYIKYAYCGIFDSRNIACDPMSNIFRGKYFTVNLCFYYSYFEVFGTTEKEFQRLRKFYGELIDNLEA